MNDNFFRDIREQLHCFIKIALDAVDAGHLVRRSLDILKKDHPELFKRFFLDKSQPLHVIGSGKAVEPMTKTVLSATRRQTSGILVGPTADWSHSKIDYIRGGHPIPTQDGVRGATRLLQYVEKIPEDSDIIVLLSGGASSFLSIPTHPLQLPELIELYRHLITSGATIQEINTVRKFCSILAGGGLARKAFPRHLLCLILSDVVGDRIDIIGSGPTAQNTSTSKEAASILSKFNLDHKLSVDTVNRINTILRKAEAEQIIPDIYSRVKNIIIGNNQVALEALAEKATGCGYKVITLTELQEGTVTSLVKKHIEIVKRLSYSTQTDQPILLLSGGESTLHVENGGKGGRNQHFVLESIPFINDLPIVTASIGSDGVDGNSEAAGAIADGGSLKRAISIGLDIDKYRNSFDSYHFFKRLNDLIITGPTGTNVMDIRIFAISATADHFSAL